MTNNCQDDASLVEKLVKEARDETGGEDASASAVWACLQHKLHPSMPFCVHQKCYETVYQHVEDVCPSWIPSEETIQQSNIQKMMDSLGLRTYQEFYDWSVGSDTRQDFWMQSTRALDIVWDTPPSGTFQGDSPAETTYFPDARLNISNSCFHKRPAQDAALVYAMESNPRDLQTMSFAVLDRLSNQIANAIQTKLELQPGDAIAICMPMTPESIAVYLGIVKAGCVVVSIADSFSATEIATRLRLGQAKAIFTQDVIYRGAKCLPLFARVLQAQDTVHEQQRQAQRDACQEDAKETKSDDIGALLKIVALPGMLHAGPYPKLAKMRRSDSGTWNDRDENGQPVPLHESVDGLLRPGFDWDWHTFLHRCSDHFQAVARDSMDACNILFSSGTTGEPKAIVWSHSTSIKCAVDGYYHQDIQVGDRVAWPTNIGWMMGPWLLFQLINGATIGIFNGVTSTDAFCQFIEEAKISMVGVIPSLVKAWQARNATKDCDWSCVRKFSSTGEASDPLNYLWLVSRVPGYAPVIEYCGGTEIGGSYLSSTVMQPNVPSMFSSPVLGSQILLLDGEGQAVQESNYTGGPNGTQSGEVALVPPSVGLSTKLLNRNHFDTYFRGMNKGPEGQVLRRHGDELEMVRNAQHTNKVGPCDSVMPYYRALGRCDDTMNIGGIKVGSVELERVCNLVDGVKETAAIGVSGPHGGPSKLVMYVVLEDSINKEAQPDSGAIRAAMQKSIKAQLNPLFGISDVVVTASLPRTASNKVMRRVLRDDYLKSATL